MHTFRHWLLSKSLNTSNLAASENGAKHVWSQFHYCPQLDFVSDKPGSHLLSYQSLLNVQTYLTPSRDGREGGKGWPIVYGTPVLGVRMSWTKNWEEDWVALLITQSNLPDWSVWDQILGNVCVDPAPPPPLHLHWYAKWRSPDAIQQLDTNSINKVCSSLCFLEAVGELLIG